jgi:hypothetical protein
LERVALWAGVALGSEPLAPRQTLLAVACNEGSASFTKINIREILVGCRPALAPEHQPGPKKIAVPRAADGFTGFRLAATGAR